MSNTCVIEDISGVQVEETGVQAKRVPGQPIIGKTQIKRQKANTKLSYLFPEEPQVCSEEMNALNNELAMLKAALGEGTPVELVTRMMPLVNSQTDLNIFQDI